MRKPKEAQNIGVQPEVPTSKKSWSDSVILGRRELVASALLPFLLNGHRANSLPTRPEAREEKEENEITLGNVRFYLEREKSLSPKERGELFAKMNAAYTKLVGFLGAEIMTMPQSMQFPIRINAVNADARNKLHGKVEWTIGGGRSDLNDGDLTITGAVEPSYIQLENISEDVIAHEFVHLFVQIPGIWRESFYEGHAYAIQHSLYPFSGTIDSIIQMPQLKDVLRTPLDYSRFDKEILKGGVPSSALTAILTYTWEKDWTELSKKDPNFFKNFYTEIAQLRKKGIFSVTKKELLDVAHRASPHFQPWYETKTSMREIAEQGSVEILRAIYISSENAFLVFNFKTMPRRIISADKGTPPYLDFAVEGKLEASYKDPLTSKLVTISFEREDNRIAMWRLPPEVLTNPTLAFTIGGKEVPLMR